MFKARDSGKIDGDKAKVIDMFFSGKVIAKAEKDQPTKWGMGHAFYGFNTDEELDKLMELVKKVTVQ